MSITITVPNDDHVALRAMAKALEEIAVARGASLQVNLVTQEMLDKLKETRAGNIVCEPEVDTTSEQVESLSSVVNHEVHFDNHSPQVSDATTDSNGTPWDERIHSASKALNSDGTWRLRRKPADKTPEEWTAYVKWVEEDIHLVMSLQGESEEDGDKYSVEGLIVSVASASPDVEPYDVAQEKFTAVAGFADEPSVTSTTDDAMQELVDTTQAMGLYDIEPPVTPEGDDFHVDAGEVTEQHIAAIPLPPVPQVEEKTAPGGHEHAHMTFPQVMQFLTERHGRITSAQVDEIISDMGLNSIMDLNTQPEHTGPFIARVKALLGE